MTPHRWACAHIPNVSEWLSCSSLCRLVPIATTTGENEMISDACSVSKWILLAVYGSTAIHSLVRTRSSIHDPPTHTFSTMWNVSPLNLSMRIHAFYATIKMNRCRTSVRHLNLLRSQQTVQKASSAKSFQMIYVVFSNQFRLDILKHWLRLTVSTLSPREQ